MTDGTQKPNAVVTFSPENITFVGAEGETVMAIADRHGVPIATRCHGEARCGACLVLVLAGAENLGPVRIDERDHLARPGHRLACRARVFGPVVVRRVHDPGPGSGPPPGSSNESSTA